MDIDIVRELPPAVTSVPEARRMVRDALGAELWDDIRHQVELAVSELATNAVIHAGTPFTLRVQTTGSFLRVEVSDRNSHIPHTRHYSLTARTGRGMQLLATSVDRWGADPTTTGKTIWFEIGDTTHQTRRAETHQPPKDDVPTTEVILRNVPVLMHWAWQEHIQATLRDDLLSRLGQDLHVTDEHAQASDALSVLFEQITQPLLPDDPNQLLAESLEPDVTLDEVVVHVPLHAVPHFATLSRVLAQASEAPHPPQILAPPRQPEIEELTDWLCQEVERQSGPGKHSPLPWRTRAETQVAVDPTDQELSAHLDLTSSTEHALVANASGVIVAVTQSVSRFLGYQDDTDLVGRRVLTVVPTRYHQAHIAGITLNATNGRDALLDVPITVPVLCADGSEVLVGLRITPHNVGQSRLFVADFELPYAEPRLP